MCRVVGRDPGRDQHRVQAAPDPVDARVGPEMVVGLQVQPVLDGEEVQQSAFGLLGQLAPVAGGEQPLRLGVGFPPRGGMPASTVEGNRQMQGGHWSRVSTSFPIRATDFNGTVLTIISLDIVDYALAPVPEDASPGRARTEGTPPSEQGPQPGGPACPAWQHSHEASGSLAFRVASTGSGG